MVVDNSCRMSWQRKQGDPAFVDPPGYARHVSESTLLLKVQYAGTPCECAVRPFQKTDRVSSARETPYKSLWLHVRAPVLPGNGY